LSVVHVSEPPEQVIAVGTTPEKNVSAQTIRNEFAGTVFAVVNVQVVSPDPDVARVPS